MKLLIKGVELNGVATDIYIENKYIKQIGPGLSVAADKVIDGSRRLLFQDLSIRIHMRL